jgi:hypothetical protein
MANMKDYWRDDSDAVSVLKAVVSSNGHPVAKNYNIDSLHRGDVGIHIRFDRNFVTEIPPEQRAAALAIAKPMCDAILAMLGEKKESGASEPGTIWQIERPERNDEVGLLLDETEITYKFKVFNPEIQRFVTVKYPKPQTCVREVPDYAGETGLLKYWIMELRHFDLLDRLADSEQEFFALLLERYSTNDDVRQALRRINSPEIFIRWIAAVQDSLSPYMTRIDQDHWQLVRFACAEFVPRLPRDQRIKFLGKGAFGDTFDPAWLEGFSVDQLKELVNSGIDPSMRRHALSAINDPELNAAIAIDGKHVLRHKAILLLTPEQDDILGGIALQRHGEDCRDEMRVIAFNRIHDESKKRAAAQAIIKAHGKSTRGNEYQALCDHAQCWLKAHPKQAKPAKATKQTE